MSHTMSTPAASTEQSCAVRPVASTWMIGATWPGIAQMSVSERGFHALSVWSRPAEKSSLCSGTKARHVTPRSCPRRACISRGAHLPSFRCATFHSRTEPSREAVASSSAFLWMSLASERSIMLVTACVCACRETTHSRLDMSHPSRQPSSPPEKSSDACPLHRSAC